MRPLLDVERDLTVRAERLEGHLHIFRRAQGDQVPIFVLVFDTKRAVVPPRPTETDLLAYFFHQFLVLGLTRHLNDKDIIVEVHLDLDT